MSQYLSSSQGAYSGLSQAILMSQNINGLPSGANGLFQGSQLSQHQNGLSQSSSGLNQMQNTPTINVNQSSSLDQNNLPNGSTSNTQRTVIEEVTPVSSKCLAKALRPPVTIKNFFKASTNPKNEKNESNIGVSEGKKEDKTIVRKEISYEAFLKAAESGEGTSACSTVDIDNKNDDTKDVVTKIEMEDNSSGSNSKTDSPCAKSPYFSTSSKKRSLDDKVSSQPCKKPKQATLFSTLKKMKTKKEEEENKPVTCPICCKVFEKGISNTDLNSHIDNCIIE